MIRPAGNLPIRSLLFFFFGLFRLHMVEYGTGVKHEYGAPHEGLGVRLDGLNVDRPRLGSPVAVPGHLRALGVGRASGMAMVNSDTVGSVWLFFHDPSDDQCRDRDHDGYVSKTVGQSVKNDSMHTHICEAARVATAADLVRSGLFVVVLFAGARVTPIPGRAGCQPQWSWP